MTVPLADSSTVRGRGAVVEGRAEPDGGGGAAGVGHLRGDGALPDQLVEGELLAAQLAGHLGRGAEPVTGGADRLVRLLGVLDLLLVVARGVGHVLGAVHLARLGAGGGQRGLRQRGAVGPHVGDVAVLVEPLGDPHRVAAVEPQLARGLLLQGARRERRARAAGVRLLGDVGDGDVGGRAARWRCRWRRPRRAGVALALVSVPSSAKSRPVATLRAVDAGEAWR